MENMQFLRKLPVPKEVKEKYPLDKELSDIKKQNDIEISNIIKGIDRRFLVIVGPCSADNPQAILDYANKIKDLQDKVKDKIKIVLRCYTSKPRTKGEGYMGLLHQPDPNGNVDLLEGLITCRKLFIDIMKNTNLPIADEILYPQNFRYFSDCISYATVGARSILDQEHRLVSSGLSIPVGMKNSLSGNYDDCINAVYSVRNSHKFLYRGWEVTTSGNDLAHIILRGYIDSNNQNVSNYDIFDIDKLDMLLHDDNMSSCFIIDCSHSNSNKEYLKQIDVCNNVLDNIEIDPKYRNLVRGIMIESYLTEGSGTEQDHLYGQSITDSCLGIKDTIELINNIYNRL